VTTGDESASADLRGETLRQRLARTAKERRSWIGRVLYASWSFHRTTAVPFPRVVGWVLRTERDARVAGWGFLKRVLYYDPMFRSYCERVGKRLHLDGACPLVLGEGRIVIGDDVTIGAPTTFAFARSSGRETTLSIGDRSVVSCAVAIFAASYVSIGADCVIGPGTIIFDNPTHPVEAEARLNREPVDASEIRPVTIEDKCWISSHVRILPGVRVGCGSVVGTSSVVTKDIPPESLAAGNPARVIRSLAPGERRGFIARGRAEGNAGAMT
jgi:acetyltransferase-like isoleucine patch superfamily enzyme